MISIKKVGENLYRAYDDKIWLEYYKESEYVNATALCKLICRRDCLERWMATKQCKDLMFALGRDLEDASYIVEPVCYIVDESTFIHPSLVPHLSTWLGPKYNYPVCKLQKQIMYNNVVDNMARLNVKPIPKHYFTLFELNDPKLGPLKQFKTIEGEEKMVMHEQNRLVKKHPKARIIFQHHQVPDTAKVLLERL